MTEEVSPDGKAEDKAALDGMDPGEVMLNEATKDRVTRDRVVSEHDIEKQRGKK